MKKGIIVCQISLLLLLSCTSVSESDFFAFDVEEFRDLASEPLHLDVRECSANLFTAAINGGYIYSYESSKDWLFTLTDIETDEIAYKMGRRGRGPDEFINVFPLQDFFVEEGDTKTLMFCYNDARLLTWNITRSLTTGKEVYENLIHLGDSTKYLPFGSLHPLSGDRLLVLDTKQNPRIDDMVAPPVYAVYDLNDRSVCRTYDLFREPKIKIKSTGLHSKLWFSLHDGIKSDGTKVFMAMGYFPQINILDLDSGECRGFRIKEARKFSPDACVWHFTSAVSDDNYIYALYYGGLEDPSDYDACPDVLYVFDWNGNVVRKLQLDEHVTDVWLNGELLYLYHRVRPNLYYVKIDDVISSNH